MEDPGCPPAQVRQCCLRPLFSVLRASRLSVRGDLMQVFAGLTVVVDLGDEPQAQRLQTKVVKHAGKWV